MTVGVSVPQAPFIQLTMLRVYPGEHVCSAIAATPWISPDINQILILTDAQADVPAFSIKRISF